MAMKKFKSVDDFLSQVQCWQDEVKRLREILLTTELEETLKWSFPCYVFEGKNIVGLGAFQSYFGIWFFQGALMEDPDGILVNAQQGKTKGMRQWRMTHQREIKVRQIKKYVKNAIAVQAAGLEIKAERGKAIVIHPIFESALQENRKAAIAFAALSTGRKREYSEYINDAKRDETKVRRVAKILPMIEEGVGLNDRYRS